ncbi:MAG: hypothetical protein V9E90_14005 [Saprospiraceae bacterium]|jgi:hypothetical protein
MVFVEILMVFSLFIYDRWGDLVGQKQGFAVNELRLGWDGRFQGQDVLPGVYVWHAQLALKDGSAITKKMVLTVLK